MFEITRKRLAGILSALAMTLAFVLVLVTGAFAGGPILNRVNAGGPDACGFSPGCDGNFSLSARMYADESVNGQWSDQFGHGFGGFQANIDCLLVDGNKAWVSGVVTQGVIHDPIFGDVPLAGVRVAGRVEDNGTSRNDPADQISRAVFEDAPFGPIFKVCTEQPSYTLYEIPYGQVKVD